MLSILNETYWLYLSQALSLSMYRFLLDKVEFRGDNYKNALIRIVIFTFNTFAEFH